MTLSFFFVFYLKTCDVISVEKKQKINFAFQKRKQLVYILEEDEEMVHARRQSVKMFSDKGISN